MNARLDPKAKRQRPDLKRGAAHEKALGHESSAARGQPHHADNRAPDGDRAARGPDCGAGACEMLYLHLKEPEPRISHRNQKIYNAKLALLRNCPRSPSMLFKTVNDINHLIIPLPSLRLYWPLSKL